MSLVLACNLKTKAITQYRNYLFNSFAKIGDTYLAASDDGIYSIDSQERDNGRIVRSEFDLPISDFGDEKQKRIRRYFFSGEFYGDLTLEVTDDEGNTRSFPIRPEKTDGSQCGAVANVDMDGKGRFWKTTIKSNGVDFSIDKIMVRYIRLSRKLSGVI